MHGVMGDTILVKSIKIDGQNFDNPLPSFEYDGKVGVWVITVKAERAADFFATRHGQEVEVGMHFGTVRAVGRVRTWQSALPDMPAFIARIVGNDPMRFVER
jgi:hypothetical protein